MSYTPFVNLLAQASTLKDAEVDKAAHALGWPKPGERPRGRTKWKEPFRNDYLGDADDPDWKALEEVGLAERLTPPVGHDATSAYWRVTERGRLVVQAYLVAHRAVASRLSNAKEKEEPSP